MGLYDKLIGFVNDFERSLINPRINERCFLDQLPGYSVVNPFLVKEINDSKNVIFITEPKIHRNKPNFKIDLDGENLTSSIHDKMVLALEICKMDIMKDTNAFYLQNHINKELTEEKNGARLEIYLVFEKIPNGNPILANILSDNGYTTIKMIKKANKEELRDKTGFPIEMCEDLINTALDYHDDEINL